MLTLPPWEDRKLSKLHIFLFVYLFIFILFISRHIVLFGFILLCSNFYIFFFYLMKMFLNLVYVSLSILV